MIIIERKAYDGDTYMPRRANLVLGFGARNDAINILFEWTRHCSTVSTEALSASSASTQN